MSKIDKMVGQRIGNLIIKGRDSTYKSLKYIKVICECDCGNIKTYYSHNITSGSTTSCGCTKNEKLREHSSTHGMTGTPEFRIFECILRRCNNQNASNFERYGGRGITVCDRWQGENGFQNFYEDMGPKPGDKYSIDRIDNNLGYGPSNCKWSTSTEQAQNRRNNVIESIDQANDIRKLWKTNRYTQRELADSYKCTTSTISAIVNNRQWKNKTG